MPRGQLSQSDRETQRRMRLLSTATTKEHPYTKFHRRDKTEQPASVATAEESNIGINQP